MGVIAVPGIEGRIPTAEHVVVAAEVMGTFRVVVDGLEIPATTWQRTAATTLFKLLLIAPHQRLSREAAAEILWPEMDPCHQATNLRKALHFARKTLERGKPVIAAGHRYISLAPGVELRLDLLTWLDAASRLRGRRVEEESEPLADPDVELVLRLGQQLVLPDDPYADWVEQLRQRVSRQSRDLAVRVAAACVRSARYTTAETLADELLARDPADEEAHRIMIELLVAQGRDHAARCQFLRCARELAGAFGIEPGPATAAALNRPARSSPAGAARTRNAGGTPTLPRFSPLRIDGHRWAGGRDNEAPAADGLAQPATDALHGQPGHSGRSCHRPARTNCGRNPAEHRNLLSG